MRAIIFDFFGTLTDPRAEVGRRTAFEATAAALGVPAGDFWAAMGGSYPQRIVGRYGGTRSTLAAIARQCGVTPTDDRLDAAVAVQVEGAERVRPPRPGVLELLDRLRAAGFRIGLISDCSSELCEAWPTTPYAPRVDVPVFSWREGYGKPDQRLYSAAAERLRVPAAECWYVGDGGSREHDGARRAGMRPVLVTNAAFPEVGGLRTDPDSFRPDAVIDDLDELPSLLRVPA
ncbi:HAD family hydrolase [Actinoplanes sp. NPDC051343]|uniref:HAD family hydrolase n=1 Tax=Actinoplanes sp. NPDC051343 TaxID=3363906 RepID=UPI0037882ECC